MNYWEDFFSLDKIIYPSATSILMGIVYFIFSYLMNLSFSEPSFYLFIGIGFLIGNVIKIKILEQERSKEHKILDKKRKRKQ